MINVTKEQIVETLKRLRDYSYWMYFTPQSLDNFKKHKVTHKNHTIAWDITPEGYVSLTLENGIQGIFDPSIVSAVPTPNTLSNQCIQFTLRNQANLTPEYIEYFKEVGIFVGSFFQREAAFTFFARMQNESIELIANELTKCNETPSKPTT